MASSPTRPSRRLPMMSWRWSQYPCTGGILCCFFALPCDGLSALALSFSLFLSLSLAFSRSLSLSLCLLSLSLSLSLSVPPALFLRDSIWSSIVFFSVFSNSSPQLLGRFRIGPLHGFHSVNILNIRAQDKQEWRFWRRSQSNSILESSP